eukprot:4180240-Amphidinium_carterae.1
MALTVRQVGQLQPAGITAGGTHVDVLDMNSHVLVCLVPRALSLGPRGPQWRTADGIDATTFAECYLDEKINVKMFGDAFNGPGLARQHWRAHRVFPLFCNRPNASLSTFMVREVAELKPAFDLQVPEPMRSELCGVVLLTHSFTTEDVEASLCIANLKPGSAMRLSRKAGAESWAALAYCS